MRPTMLPFGFGELDWGDWVHGVIAAFLGGGASAFSAGVANVLNHPTHGIWNAEFWSEVSTTFVIAGLIALMAFLRTKPAPDKKVVVTTTQTLEQGPPITKTTVVETHTEPIRPKSPDA